jgi:hypothetical protein
MIPCIPAPEPGNFDQSVRQPGLKWLASHPQPGSLKVAPPWRPLDYWSEIKSQLAAAFNDLCAYGAMYEPVGTVDHFLAVSTNPHLAYEWSNYRYASAWINSSKQNASNIMDPFDVKADWFEIILPSLQLVLTEKVPKNLRPTAQYTLERLKVIEDERILRQRQHWSAEFLAKRLSLEGLRRHAPLIARAIDKQNTPQNQSKG